MEFLDRPTRHLFFTGKGGVGKTSVASATAITLADRGARVLLVSTDPASNLDEVLQTELAPVPRPVAGVPGLHALNLDPVAAADAYRERIVGPYRELLPAATITSMEEQLSGACTVEIAAFDEFSRLLGDPSATADFDHVVFDTAPTGHTLRLLTLPSAWSGFLEGSQNGASCLGPLAGLEKQRALYEATLRALADGAATTLVLVTRPERAALAEAARTSTELAALQIRNQHLVINGVFRAAGADPIADALQARSDAALSEMPSALTALPRTEVPLAAHALLGSDALRALLGGGTAPAAEGDVDAAALPPALTSLLPTLEAAGHGVILTMGKGGVGKTTVAAALAAELAARGHRVHLTTTDPAAHVAQTLGDNVAHLRLSRIDPAEETRLYTEEVLATAGAGLDAQGRALLEEDLRSPCTEEIAVFRAFARAVDEGRDGFVLLDTAPTGHTLLLLDATEAYHREVLRQGSNMPEEVRQLLPRLRDPDFTRVLVVTLPEATPVHEAAKLQADLRRASIEPFAWVIEQSFAAVETSDPVLRQRQQRETRYIDEVRGLSQRTVLVPWVPEPPVGLSRLRALVTTGPRPSQNAASQLESTR